jgi:prevent-host-death family protein
MNLVTSGVWPMARTMSAAEFKAKCLQVMDEVAASGESVILTKRGRPVAQLSPLARKPRTLRGFLKGRIKTSGDIVGPIEVRWDVDRP